MYRCIRQYELDTSPNAADSSLICYNMKKDRTRTLWARADCGSTEADGAHFKAVRVVFLMDILKINLDELAINFRPAKYDKIEARTKVCMNKAVVPS